jgi:glycosyltransferase involved in cell wall biosynthesis
VISSLRRGGRERQLATIFKYTRGSELDSRILAFNKVDIDYTEEYGLTAEDVYYLGSKKTLKRISGICKVLKEFKPDVAYVWGSFEYNFCFLLAPFSKTKFINGSIRHGIVLFNRKQVNRLIVLHLSKYIIANSKAGLKANKLNRGYVLYNGIEKKFSAPFSPKEKKRVVDSVFDRFDGETILISVANLVPYKDYFTTLKALKNVKDKGLSFKYMAIGEGPMRESLEEEIHRLGLHEDVRLVGRKSNVEDFLRAGDLFIHSSKGEGCSNAILEAMAASLPSYGCFTSRHRFSNRWHSRDYGQRKRPPV